MSGTKVAKDKEEELAKLGPENMYDHLRQPTCTVEDTLVHAAGRITEVIPHQSFFSA